MENESEKAIKGRYKMNERPEERLAIRAKDLVDAINHNINKFPNWLFEPFLTGKIYISEGAVYIGQTASKSSDWIIQGLDGNLIFCSSKNFERIRKMLKEKAENEREERN